jgi:hypothetical protein
MEAVVSAAVAASRVADAGRVGDYYIVLVRLAKLCVALARDDGLLLDLAEDPHDDPDARHLGGHATPSVRQSVIETG